MIRRILSELIFSLIMCALVGGGVIWIFLMQNWALGI